VSVSADAVSAEASGVPESVSRRGLVSRREIGTVAIGVKWARALRRVYRVRRMVTCRWE
jgi:hypothetical protein